MKKFYLCLTMLLSLFGTASMSADDVIASLGEPLTSLESLQPGQQVVLYNYGRQGYLMEKDNQSLVLTAELPFSELESQKYLWTLETLSKNNDGSATATFKSTTGNYIPELVSGKANSSAATAERFTISVSATGAGLWNILGSNGLYFNGNGYVEDEATFTGWNQAGGNSDYQIILPTLGQVDAVTIDVAYVDAASGLEITGHDNPAQLRGLTGMVVEEAPAIEHYTFVSGVDGNTGETLEFPVTVEESTNWILMYSAWAHVVFTCVNEDGDVLQVVDNYYEPGTVIEVPVIAGYTLTDEGYEDGYTVEEDAEITLTYRMGGNLPFETTTVADGEFAEGTQWYTMALRGTKYLQYEPGDTDGNYTTVVNPATFGDSLQWCFTGDIENGFKIYNKQAGAGQVLYATGLENGNSLLMGADSDELANSVFMLSTNGDGFAFTVKGTDYACINDFQALDNLKIWNNEAAPTDPGSSIVFEKYDSVAIAKRAYAPYLNTEGCVGGWSAADLTAVRKAYDNNDLDGLAEALAQLESADTIAFDPQASYELVSAYRAFLTEQPGKSFALYNATDAEGLNYVGWKELESDNSAFQWYFVPGEQEGTYTIGSLSAAEAAIEDASLEPTFINEFRFGGQATLVTGEEVGEYTLVKSAVEPAAYNLVCYYVPEGGGRDKITLCAGSGSLNAALTEGTITTYNTIGTGYANTWRLRPVGTLTGINGATVDTDEAGKTDVIYDLTGRRVTKATKGIYIVNGKKIYVK